jgi:hypothetical protein
MGQMTRAAAPDWRKATKGYWTVQPYPASVSSAPKPARNKISSWARYYATDRVDSALLLALIELI